MKRSHINKLIQSASVCFETHGWALPPRPRWDVTDFGLGEWEGFGLVLITLAEEPEYCEISTRNDDVNDNIFVNPDIGRYHVIEEDEEPLNKL